MLFGSVSGSSKNCLSPAASLICVKLFLCKLLFLGEKCPAFIGNRDNCTGIAVIDGLFVVFINFAWRC